MTKRQKGHLSLFDAFLYLFFIALSLVFIYPIWYCLITALSSGDAIRQSLPLIVPADLTFEAFKSVFEGPNVLIYFRNSVFYAVTGTVISLTLTSMMAYPLIIKDFKGAKLLNIYMIITMFFSGGLLPYYYLITEIGMRNTIWVMLLPGAVSAFNVIIFRTFFKSVPAELRDAAHIDGAGHYRVLWQIMIPVSKPLLATFGLFGLVAIWNDWFNPYLFLTNDHLKPIQVYLRETLIVTSGGIMNKYDGVRLQEVNVTELSLKCAIVIITIFPIICVYPFLQKYFAKGMMIGSLK
ncbi:carbohydrate ABC transporter permease [Paenibacillus nasutitermitis]|nr:carbohydrate ABC transporter permease [Paenibacillus nasutitermitis]